MPVKGWRWWAMRQLMRFNPMVLFAGSPLLNGYLRLLGAQVGAHAHIATPVLPVCTDLIRIGDDSLIGRQVRLPGCRAEAGRMWLGPVEIGQGCLAFVALALQPLQLLALSGPCLRVGLDALAASCQRGADRGCVRGVVRRGLPGRSWRAGSRRRQCLQQSA